MTIIRFILIALPKNRVKQQSSAQGGLMGLGACRPHFPHFR